MFKKSLTLFLGLGLALTLVVTSGCFQKGNTKSVAEILQSEKEIIVGEINEGYNQYLKVLEDNPLDFSKFPPLLKEDFSFTLNVPDMGDVDITTHTELITDVTKLTQLSWDNTFRDNINNLVAEIDMQLEATVKTPMVAETMTAKADLSVIVAEGSIYFNIKEFDLSNIPQVPADFLVGITGLSGKWMQIDLVSLADSDSELAAVLDQNIYNLISVISDPEVQLQLDAMVKKMTNPMETIMSQKKLLDAYLNEVFLVTDFFIVDSQENEGSEFTLKITEDHLKDLAKIHIEFMEKNMDILAEMIPVLNLESGKQEFLQWIAEAKEKLANEPIEGWEDILVKAVLSGDRLRNLSFTTNPDNVDINIGYELLNDTQRKISLDVASLDERDNFAFNFENTWENFEWGQGKMSFMAGAPEDFKLEMDGVVEVSDNFTDDQHSEGELNINMTMSEADETTGLDAVNVKIGVDGDNEGVKITADVSSEPVNIIKASLAIILKSYFLDMGLNGNFEFPYGKMSLDLSEVIEGGDEVKEIAIPTDAEDFMKIIDAMY